MRRGPVDRGIAVRERADGELYAHRGELAPDSLEALLLKVGVGSALVRVLVRAGEVGHEPCEPDARELADVLEGIQQPRLVPLEAYAAHAGVDEGERLGLPAEVRRVVRELLRELRAAEPRGDILLEHEVEVLAVDHAEHDDPGLRRDGPDLKRLAYARDREAVDAAAEHDLYDRLKPVAVGVGLDYAADGGAGREALLQYLYVVPEGGGVDLDPGRPQSLLHHVFHNKIL